MTIYASDPDAAPDTEFVPGDLDHLVAGNQGRLLDARRTPVSVTAVRPGRGEFELEVGAFEDAGARWALALEEVAHLQFPRHARTAAPDVVAALKEARERFSRRWAIDCDPAARRASLARLAAERASAREWLARHDAPPGDLAALTARREGDPRLFALLDQFLSERGVAELDRRFSQTFVSNPRSGELVKGHAIVLAELGLCSYHGMVVRDPDLFAEPWSKARRSEHLLARLGFTQALLSSWGHDAVTLYRGAAADGALPERSHASFVSATFSSEVAASHFEGGPSTRTAVLWRQEVPAWRVLMTFLETPAMNARFSEAEAVLIGDPDNRAF